MPLSSSVQSLCFLENYKHCLMLACPIFVSAKTRRHYLAAKRNALNCHGNYLNATLEKTLYILDEPTTGLHFYDIEQLLAVLHRLRDHGNTVVIIEHNLDVIKTADWIIDMGPEGGDGGGEIIAQGMPALVADSTVSHTGHYLKPLIEKSKKGLPGILKNK